MNGLFLLLAMGLCALALGFVLYPLLRTSPREQGQSSRALTLALHRDRLSELDQDLAAGTLTQAQYDTALADLERELLDSGAVDPDDPRAAAGLGVRRAPLVAACLSVAALPFLATGLYLTVGHAEDVFAAQIPAGTPPPLEVESEPRSEAGLQREFQHLAQQLQGRLAQEPGDVESWVLLGRTLAFLKDLEAAERAFREAMVHGGDRDPDLLARYADVIAERQGSLAGEPQRLIARALDIDPEHVQGLWLAGSLALQQADESAARDYWERLLGVLPQGSPEAEVIEGNLKQLDQTAAAE
ncbi:c-type cytochrome biogenesis protein CcmI [Billgrantia sp. LNSP4103-1]|uniref:c-type cytochrome biogenesis protein CcmI n=1 Tax=Billgrantia sp. LNSP4103-1 TaxID=3410266 RepID=UPI00403F50A7